MASIVYLDVDDEITSAAARIRSGEKGRVALVVPYGSRLGTSRINFRLLAREAQIRDRRLSVVAGDAGTRALAASAGIAVFASVAEYEDALATPPVLGEEGAPLADATVVAGAARVISVPSNADRRSEDLEATRVMPVPAPVSIPVTKRIAVRASTIGVGLRRRLADVERPTALVASGVIGLAVVALAVASWVLLPSARILVTAREEAIGPIELTIRADPAADVPDAAARVVPAERLTFPLSATDTFTATDKRVAQTAASGTVMFRSYNTGNQNTIPRGSVVSTEGGIQFVTRNAVVLARATVVFPRTVIPTSATVAVDALRQGPAGNVPANSITVIPVGENPEVTTVNNPDPTTGGTREEFPRIGKSDVDAAVDQLTLQLGTDFEAILADPSRTPNGLTLFLGTRSIADPAPSVDPQSLVGKEVQSFELGLTSTGAVIAADTTPVATIAESRVRDRVAADHRLVESSIRIDIGTAVVEGESVTFPVRASAAQVRLLDAGALRELVKGRPLADARAVLSEFGDVDLTVWPDWVSSIPTIDARLEVKVGPEAPGPEPGGTSSPGPGGSSGSGAP